MKYSVKMILSDKSRNTYYLILDEATDWLLDNIDRKAKTFSLDRDMTVRFKHEEDAMAFKLKFL